MFLDSSVLKAVSDLSPFLSGIKDQIFTSPASHGEGRFYVSEGGDQREISFTKANPNRYTLQMIPNWWIVCYKYDATSFNVQKKGTM